MAAPKVLFIGGSGRNGSTILANVLGQIPGCCSVGELRYLWDRGLVENRHCGCGARFNECPFWRDVLARAFPDPPDGRELWRLREAGLRSRHLLLPSAASRKLAAPAYQDYLRATRRLYPAIQAVTGCDVIVDSSKFPSYQAVLESFGEFDLYTVHLVRDPRAVTFSYCCRRKARSPFEQTRLEPRRPLTTALNWHEWNVLLRRNARQRPDRYLMVRYEDFTREPEAVVRRILAMVGMDGAPVPFVGDNELVLGTHHTVSGNPDRFRTGTTVIRPDEEWRRQMGWGMRTLVSAVTWPERLRYGYVEGWAR
ncbi:MAG TPA: sulfotransferase [Gemmatimonadales bacterium]|nr:sulfotransferase [Gemmatimonadales bacterium]